MNKITNVTGDQITIFTDELGLTNIVNISMFTRGYDGDNNFIMFDSTDLNITLGN